MRHHHLLRALSSSFRVQQRRTTVHLLPHWFSTAVLPINNNNDNHSTSSSASIVKLNDALFHHCENGEIDAAETIFYNQLLQTDFAGVCAQQILLAYRRIVFRNDVTRQSQDRAVHGAQQLIMKTEQYLDAVSREKLLITFMDMNAKLGEYEKVENLADKISTTSFSLNVSLKALGKKGHVQEATEIVRNVLMGNSSFHNSILTHQTFTTLLNAWAESNRLDTFEQACEVFELFDDPRCHLQPNEYNYGALLKCVSASKRNDINIQAILDDMEERGVAPNLIVYNTAIKIYLQWNRHDLVDGLLERMRQKGVTPDTRTNNDILAHWSKLGTRDAAQRAEQVLQTITPDIFSFNMVLAAWGRVGDYYKLWDLFASLRSHSLKPDLVTVTTLLTYSSKSKNLILVQRADDLLRSMEEDGLIGVTCDFRHYFLVIRGWLGVGNVDRATELLQHSASSPNILINPKPGSYDIIVRDYVGKGQIEEAVRFLEQFQDMKKSRPDWQTWNYLLQVWKGAAHPEKDAYLQKLESIIAKVPKHS